LRRGCGRGFERRPSARWSKADFPQNRTTQL